MKKTKTSLAIAVALAAGVGTSVHAQTLNVKQDIITFSMTVMQQLSVSTSSSVINAGNWSQVPMHYRTTSKKMTQVDILRSIAIVLHGNAGFYSSQAKLELVQGELGGFWNINDAVAQSFEDFVGPDTGELTGSFNDDGFATDATDTGDGAYGELFGTYFPDGPTPYDWYGPDVSGTFDFDNFIPTMLDDNSRISLSDGPGSDFDPQGGAYARLATGRHFLPVPWANYNESTVTGTPFATTGEYPPGHMQPWGQIYVKDAGHGTAQDPLCENVTFFFNMCVEECYDCFYLSSFISQSDFQEKPGTQTGPPCCTSPGLLLGRGVDKYFLQLSFDNTVNNFFLNPALETNTDDAVVGYWYEYVGFTGLVPSVGVADGTTPDLLPYVDSIKSQLGRPSQFETRFTLDGIVTYSWTLELINSEDVAADYVGSASYSYNGYGFINLVCSLITGTATFQEAIVKDIGCCDDIPWYHDSFNSGFDDTYATGWFGPSTESDGSGYYNPDDDQIDFYPYFNIVGGESFTSNNPAYHFSLPDQNESPYNPAAALSCHEPAPVFSGDYFIRGPI